MNRSLPRRVAGLTLAFCATFGLMGSIHSLAAAEAQGAALAASATSAASSAARLAQHNALCART